MSRASVRLKSRGVEVTTDNLGLEHRSQFVRTLESTFDGFVENHRLTVRADDVRGGEWFYVDVGTREPALGAIDTGYLSTAQNDTLTDSFVEAHTDRWGVLGKWIGFTDRDVGFEPRPPRRRNPGASSG